MHSRCLVLFEMLLFGTQNYDVIIFSVLPSKRGNRKQAEMRERPKLFSDLPAKNEIGPAFNVNSGLTQ